MELNAVQREIVRRRIESIVATRRFSEYMTTIHNTISPISRLPDDVLLEIFFRLRNKNPSSLRSWHHITHVCRRWRQVALDAACLWLDPPTHQQEYTLLMLQRSRASPLYIDMDPSASAVTCAAVLENLHRISTLTLHHNAEHLARFQTALASPTLTTIPLQDLKILHDPASRGSAPATWVVPAERMATTLPSLRSLILANIAVYSDSFPIRSLTKLSLEGPHVLGLDEVFWDDLGAAMSKMDFLTHFDVNLRSFEETFPGEITFKLTLPHLTSLVLYQAPPLELGHFLDHTDFPRLQSIYVQFSWTDDIDFASISSIWTLLERGDFGRLDQLVWDCSGVSLCGGPLFKFGFKANLARTAENMTGFMTDLPTILARDIVHLRLDLDGHLDLFDDNWHFNDRRGLPDGESLANVFSVMFKTLPNIARLEVGLSQALVDALGAQHDRGSGAYTVPLASLKVIHVASVPEANEYDKEGGYCWDRLGLFSGFYGCLLSRRQRNVDLEKLSFKPWMPFAEEHRFTKLMKDRRTSVI